MEHLFIDNTAIAKVIVKALGIYDESLTDLVSNVVKVCWYNKDNIIFKEGEHPEQLYFLANGKVKLVKDCDFGHLQIVRVIKKESFLGYRAYFAKESNITSAIAFEDSMVASIPFNIVEKLMSMYPDILLFFTSELAMLLGKADSRTVSLTQKHVRGRLAETILGLMDSYGLGSDRQTLNITMSRDDLASLSNMSTSNAIRTLSSFAQEGILAIDGKKIRILDRTAIERISRMG